MICISKWYLLCGNDHQGFDKKIGGEWLEKMNLYRFLLPLLLDMPLNEGE